MWQRWFSTVSVAALVLPTSLQAYELCVDSHAALVRPQPNYLVTRQSILEESAKREPDPTENLPDGYLLDVLALEYAERRNESPERSELEKIDRRFNRLLDETVSAIGRRKGSDISLQRILEAEKLLPNDEVSRARQLSDLVELQRIHEVQADQMMPERFEHMAALEIRLPRWVEDRQLKEGIWERIETLKESKTAGDRSEAVRFLGMLDLNENQLARDELMHLATTDKAITVRTAARQALLAHGVKVPRLDGDPDMGRSILGRDWAGKRDELARLDDESFRNFLASAPVSFLQNREASALLASRDLRLIKELLRKKDGNYRHFALGGLQGRFDDESLAILEKFAVKDPDPAVRRRAIEILIGRNDFGALTAIQRVSLKNPEEVARYRERVIHKKIRTLPDEEIDALLSSGNPSDHRRVLGQLEARLPRTLLKALDSPDKEVREAAIDSALGRLQDGRLTGEAKDSEVLNLLAAAVLKGRDENLIVYTLDALHAAGGPKSWMLLKEAAKSTNPRVARVAQEKLEQPLYNVRAFSADPQNRTFNMEQLWTNEQIDAALRSGDEAQQLLATEHLFGRPTQLISDALHSNSPRVRLHAVDALDGRSDPESVELLSQAMKDPVADVRIEAINALNWIHSDEADALMEKALRDPNPRVSQHALRKILSDERQRSSRGATRHAQIVQKLESQRLEQMKGNDRSVDQQQLAMDFASHVYRAPVREAGITPENLVRKESEFRQSAPPGYQVDIVYHDPRTGLAYCYYKPLDHMRGRPNVFAIAGTRGWKDVAADLQLGLSQGQSGALKAMLAEVQRDLRAGENVTLTGHSLGGGLAQMFAYNLQLGLNGAEQPGRVALSTINAFGATEIIKRQLALNKQKFDPAIAKQIQAVHYVHQQTRNGKAKVDIVARLGTHLGGQVLGIEKQTDMKGLHRLTGVQSSLSNGDGLKSSEPIAIKQIPFVTNFLASPINFIGAVAKKYTDAQFRRTWKGSLETICAAREKWMEQTGYQDLRPLNDDRSWLNLEIREIVDNLPVHRRLEAQKLVDASNLRIRSILREKQSLPGIYVHQYPTPAPEAESSPGTLGVPTTVSAPSAPIPVIRVPLYEPVSAGAY